MASLRDGLGGEELQISGLQAGGVSISPYFVGSVTASTDITALTGSIIGEIINDTNGALFSTVAYSGAPAVYGARIQMGSTLTGAEGFGSAIFNVPFANTSYFWTAQVGSTGGFLSVDAGSWNVTISGPGGRLTSGVVFKGAPSSPYTWMAVGLV